MARSQEASTGLPPGGAAMELATSCSIPRLCDVQVIAVVPGASVVVQTPIPYANHRRSGVTGSKRMSPFDM